nr:MarR family transcriptional regulator [Angustibacter aerolatus]
MHRSRVRFRSWTGAHTASHRRLTNHIRSAPGRQSALPTPPRSVRIRDSAWISGRGWPTTGRRRSNCASGGPSWWRTRRSPGGSRRTSWASSGCRSPCTTSSCRLAEAPGRRLRMTDLAEAVLLSRSGLTRLVDRMTRAGYVRREPSPNDARGVYAVLTDAGHARLRRAAPTHLRGVTTYVLDQATPEELEALGTACSKAAAADERHRLPTG